VVKNEETARKGKEGSVKKKDKGDGLLFNRDRRPKSERKKKGSRNQPGAIAKRTRRGNQEREKTSAK